MRFLMFAAIAVALFGMPAEATEPARQQVEMIGPGLFICVNWTDHHRTDERAHVWEQVWVYGYLSGLVGAGWGHPLADLASAPGSAAADQINSWVDKFCLFHPMNTIADAALAYAQEHAH